MIDRSSDACRLQVAEQSHVEAQIIEQPLVFFSMVCELVSASALGIMPA